VPVSPPNHITKKHFRPTSAFFGGQELLLVTFIREPETKSYVRKTAIQRRLAKTK
jgi:hypothetical protein